MDYGSLYDRISSNHYCPDCESNVVRALYHLICCHKYCPTCEIRVENVQEHLINAHPHCSECSKPADNIIIHLVESHRYCPLCDIDNIGHVSQHLTKSHKIYRRKVREKLKCQRGGCPENSIPIGHIPKHYKDYHDGETPPPDQYPSGKRPHKYNDGARARKKARREDPPLEGALADIGSTLPIQNSPQTQNEPSLPEAKHGWNSQHLQAELQTSGDGRRRRRRALTELAAQRCCDQIRRQLSDLPQGGHGLTRLEKELPQYECEFLRRLPGDPITYEEYAAVDWESHATDTDFRYKYVVCSSEEAHKILQAGTPAIPLLIPGEDSPGRVLTRDEYLRYLSTKPTIDVHKYDTRVDETGKYLLPEKMKSADAMRVFQNQEGWPVNFLNLDLYKQNEIPPCIANIPAFSILRDTREQNQSGKRSRSQPSDLSSCVGFQIFGKTGVFSLPHRDHHGVITTVLCEEGEKLWLIYPELTDEELHTWAIGLDIAPRPAPYAIYLSPGDLLIQPPGRVHAPYSITDVLMTGTMHWDSRNMVRVLLLSLYERDHPKITNEEPAREFSRKLEYIQSLWDDGAKAYPWGTKEELAVFSQLRKVWETGKRKLKGLAVPTMPLSILDRYLKLGL
ncbi:uncharacterized protein PV07_12726 [Cladophialophora immunda]|uniref:JmjC domain-containing protein n=1 Tax=Cladophialophora immunda TaxID=569365 RepID=A0A0D2BS15_9EURO|nr:uncharacterized protein PV07_12726 [Cladophialophora immunda]KIW21853.1 hypothetical protein PV07_12726 [Cladophialophora immunda]